MVERAEPKKTFAEALALVAGVSEKLAPSRLSFGEHLRQERERAKRSVWDLARGISVPQERYRAFEEMETSPTRAEYGRLCKQLRAMRFHEPEPVASPSSTVPAVEEGPASRPVRVEPLPPPKHQPKARTFGEALRQERDVEGVSPEVVGDCLGVSSAAVRQWEDDGACPVKANYDKLVDLFPRLSGAPRPEVRDIEKPVGRSGRTMLGTVVTPGAEIVDLGVKQKLVQEHYEEDLSEALVEAKDFSRNVRRTAPAHLRPLLRHVPPVPTPPPPKDPLLVPNPTSAVISAPSAETLTERIIGLCEGLRGGRWAVSFERGERGEYVATAYNCVENSVSDQATGEGARGAARALLKLLSSEVDKESASLRQQAEKTAQELRRRAEALESLKGRE